VFVRHADLAFKAVMGFLVPADFLVKRIPAVLRSTTRTGRATPSYSVEWSRTRKRKLNGLPAWQESMRTSTIYEQWQDIPSAACHSYPLY